MRGWHIISYGGLCLVCCIKYQKALGWPWVYIFCVPLFFFFLHSLVATSNDRKWKQKEHRTWKNQMDCWSFQTDSFVLRWLTINVKWNKRWSSSLHFPVHPKLNALPLVDSSLVFGPDNLPGVFTVLLSAYGSAIRNCREREIGCQPF